jgi:hypothetical protein
MTRTYDARLVALTVGVPYKWVDNLLSHYVLPGVSGGRQGLQRRIADDGLLAIEIVRAFAFGLGVPLARASKLATSAVQARAEGNVNVTLESGVFITLRFEEIERRLQKRILETIESVARVPRGRPPRKRQSR